MQQQQASAQVNQQVLSTPAHAKHLLPMQHVGLATQRPAQRFAHEDRADTCRSDAVGKAQTSDFYFGEFWHNRLKKTIEWRPGIFLSR